MAKKPPDMYIYCMSVFSKQKASIASAEWLTFKKTFFVHKVRRTIITGELNADKKRLAKTIGGSNVKTL